MDLHKWSRDGIQIQSVMLQKEKVDYSHLLIPLSARQPLQLFLPDEYEQERDWYTKYLGWGSRVDYIKLRDESKICYPMFEGIKIIKWIYQKDVFNARQVSLRAFNKLIGNTRICRIFNLYECECAQPDIVLFLEPYFYKFTSRSFGRVRVTKFGYDSVLPYPTDLEKDLDSIYLIPV